MRGKVIQGFIFDQGTLVGTDNLNTGKGGGREKQATVLGRLNVCPEFL